MIARLCNYEFAKLTFHLHCFVTQRPTGYNPPDSGSNKAGPGLTGRFPVFKICMYFPGGPRPRSRAYRAASEDVVHIILLCSLPSSRNLAASAESPGCDSTVSSYSCKSASPQLNSVISECWSICLFYYVTPSRPLAGVTRPPGRTRTQSAGVSRTSEVSLIKRIIRSLVAQAVTHHYGWSDSGSQPNIIWQSSMP